MEQLEQQESQKRIRKAAMNYLARREHALAELQTKLQQKFKSDQCIDSAAIMQQLSLLESEGLQSNQRFAENYAHARYVNGYGPERIALELQQKGISESQAHAVLLSDSYDWQSSLQNLYTKKFSASNVFSVEEKLKCQRYLSYRGFTHDQIHSLLDLQNECCS